MVGSDTQVTAAEYTSEFLPGYTDNNGDPQGKNDSNYTIYKLSHGINDFDRQRWPNLLLGNSDQQAPVFFDSQANAWKPLDFGDQTMYYIFTDSYPQSHQNQSGSTLPLMADIKQLNWSFDEPATLGNIIYTQYVIINRSALPWINTYFMLWLDDDLGSIY
ncbi:MAG: hypothetical protein L0Y77_12465 [Chlorobi bacterium]|nr:hypothetical protein [Chlorobiota bacterium]